MNFNKIREKQKTYPIESRKAKQDAKVVIPCENDVRKDMQIKVKNCYEGVKF